jgi:hypothetical protein
VSTPDITIRIQDNCVVVGGRNPLLLNKLIQHEMIRLFPRNVLPSRSTSDGLTAYAFTCLTPTDALTLADRITQVASLLLQEGPPPTGAPLKALVSKDWSSRSGFSVCITNSTPEILAAMSLRGMPCAEQGAVIECTSEAGAQAVAKKINDWLVEDATHLPGSTRVEKSATYQWTTVTLEQVYGPERQPSTWKVTVVGPRATNIISCLTTPPYTVTGGPQGPYTVTCESLGDANSAFEALSSKAR